MKFRFSNPSLIDIYRYRGACVRLDKSFSLTLRFHKRAEKHVYLIMEYCAGGDLTNYIKKRGRVEGLEYVPSPGAALQYYPHPRTGGLGG